MLAKIFRIGSKWGHETRIRETMMGDSLTACPVGLLYKDHKGWTVEKGGPPPSRNVVGGHVGVNVHVSEIFSDMIEPVVELVEGGREVVSTEDLLARVEELNESMQGWHSLKWWAGKTVGGGNSL